MVKKVSLFKVLLKRKEKVIIPRPNLIAMHTLNIAKRMIQIRIQIHINNKKVNKF